MNSHLPSTVKEIYKHRNLPGHLPTSRQSFVINNIEIYKRQTLSQIRSTHLENFTCSNMVTASQRKFKLPEEKACKNQISNRSSRFCLLELSKSLNLQLIWYEQIFEVASRFASI